MNEPNKRKPYVCPKCGRDNIECLDYEWDSDGIRQEYVCHECEAQWDEYFALEWTGYVYKGVAYDEKGAKIEQNVIEPPPAASVDPRDGAFFIAISRY